MKIIVAIIRFVLLRSHGKWRLVTYRDPFNGISLERRLTAGLLEDGKC